MRGIFPILLTPFDDQERIVAAHDGRVTQRHECTSAQRTGRAIHRSRGDTLAQQLAQGARCGFQRVGNDHDDIRAGGGRQVRALRLLRSGPRRDGEDGEGDSERAQGGGAWRHRDRRGEVNAR